MRNRDGQSQVIAGNVAFENANSAFTKNIGNGIHFYFNDENSSYLKVNSDNWGSIASSYNSIFDYDTPNQQLDFDLDVDGQTYYGYNTGNQRYRKGSYVEVFTNEQLRANPDLVFDPAGFDRNASHIPGEGIGAYKVTGMDGKTYHYALPVYQRERFSRVVQVDELEENQFQESQQLDPYATHWLLTAVTGPDYVDANNNNIPDEADYGYWVEFEYGRWSDGFVWRTPREGYENNYNSKVYEWGVKEIYYLDRVKTRTHTAVFVKEERLDDRSAIIEIHDKDDPSKPQSFRDIERGILQGDDGQFYIFGAHFLGTVTAAEAVHTIVESFHQTKVNTYDQGLLRLKDIVLVKNEFDDVNKTGGSSGELAGSILIKEQLQAFYFGALTMDEELDIVDRSWHGAYENKVIETSDVSPNGALYTNAQEVISFDYDDAYPLARNSFGSQAPGAGRLTLRSVATKGHGNTAYMPPYQFSYHSPSVPYNKDQRDDWGFHQQTPEAWSLKSIFTPTGAEINVNYASDSYRGEMAKTAVVLDNGLEIKFTQTAQGQKRVSFRNDHDDTYYENIDFRDYFTTANTAEVDIQFWKNPSGNSGPHRIADVAATVQVVSVSQNNVTFSLPTNGVQTEVRRYSHTCNAKDWVFYQRYSDVIGGTSNWAEEDLSGTCGEPGNGNARVRYQLRSNKPQVNQNGGGLRVSSLVTSGEGVSYATAYNYNDPQTGITSGVTTFAPRQDKQLDISYVSEIPAPGVTYEYVTVNKQSSTGQDVFSDRYHFKVLEPMQLTYGGFTMGDAISLTLDQNTSRNNVTVQGSNGPETANINASKLTLTDNTSSLGRLLSRTSFNRENQVIAQEVNRFYGPGELDLGVVKESFKTYKRLFYKNQPYEYKIVNSSRMKVPLILKNTTTNDKGVVSTTHFRQFDFLTGQPLETEFQLADGQTIRNESVPAYHIPYYAIGMGSKTDLSGNKNQLTQEAASFSYLVDDYGITKVLDANIMTWSNDWTYRSIAGVESTPVNPQEKIWRQKADYIWRGNLNEDGTYAGYDGRYDGFDWTLGAATQVDEWQKVSETIDYDHYSMAV
ncbi:MAG: hypothetical protein AAFO69_09860, partial [Bacteroidota bacterium]